MTQFDGCSGPRVCLWRHGHRYRPDVSTLLERTFGADVDQAPAELADYVAQAYGDDPEIQRWAATAFAS